MAAEKIDVLTREVVFHPAYDKRDPNPSKNYGIHGVDLRMYVKGLRGAVQFVLYTNWMLPHVREELDAKRGRRAGIDDPLPADLGYHSRIPGYTDAYAHSNCNVIGGTCYYDGSGLNAERIYDVLLREGSEGVWRELEAYYNEALPSLAELARAGGA